MASTSSISEELAEIEGQISDIFRALSNGFQKLEKIKDTSRQSRQLEELTGKMRDCKRLIKDFDRELKDMEYKLDAETTKMLNEKKQSMIKELNSYVALKKQYSSTLENKRVELFEGPGEGYAEDNVLLASSMTNQQLIDNGNKMMDETDQAIERSKKVVHETINVGTETAAALKAQTEQMSRIVNELDSIHFSIKKASQLVKEIGRQVATDRCIMALLVLIVIGVLAIIIVKVGISSLILIFDSKVLYTHNISRASDIAKQESPSASFFSIITIVVVNANLQKIMLSDLYILSIF
ncbi:OLC1v1031533C2 [Oldenlandia corymbosa var. corymbosa]|uniref:OLC1v1031533C2 n=1 Tax=Oldenlandia corymbosa var. corymbosa TaxID=529605 RepID=A0AAV1CKL2_OLDCO|nr:OLC1v1031533C2 [Oldenlandia corymbosa var. corymbosa]